VATVTYPLRRLYGDAFSVAPLSVLIDPHRAMRVLGIGPDTGKQFSEKVLYIYRKQLEEADVIVINKRDLLDDAQSAVLDAALAAAFPRAKRFAISARNGTGMEAWFAHMVAARQGGGIAMGVDYDTYAEGEALLGWFNATVAIEAPREVNGNALVMSLMEKVHRGLNGAEVAHLKMTLSPEDGSGEIATANLVAGDRVAELAQSLSDDITEGQLVINLRAEADPVTLQRSVEQALKDAASAFPGVMLRLEHREAFRPGRPVPTHRITTAGSA
jgi:hypothetical protein